MKTAALDLPYTFHLHTVKFSISYMKYVTYTLDIIFFFLMKGKKKTQNQKKNKTTQQKKWWGNGVILHLYNFPLLK